MDAQTTDRESLSVVIPVHGDSKTLAACLDGLRQQYHTPDEIIVVANGASPQTIATAQQSTATQVIVLPTVVGGSEARNRGVDASRSDIILFLDSDVVPHPETSQKVLQTFQSHPHISALIGSYDDAPGEPNMLSQYRNLLHHYTHQHASENAATFWGACGAIRREVFCEVGGFDAENFFFGMEDIDLGYRLRQAGYQIRLRKDLQVKHLKHWNWRTMLYADIFHRALPWSKLLLEHPEYMNDLNVKRQERLSAMLLISMLGSLGLTWRFRHLAWVTTLSSGGLLWLNAPLYRFFQRRGGTRFMLASIFFHWTYYLYSVLSFGVAWFLHQQKRLP